MIAYWRSELSSSRAYLVEGSASELLSSFDVYRILRFVKPAQNELFFLFILRQLFHRS